jgi:hypothetical protein
VLANRYFRDFDDLESLIHNFEESYPKFQQLAKAVEEFRIYIENNDRFIRHYGQRRRHEEAIATGFVESTINQVISKSKRRLAA